MLRSRSFRVGSTLFAAAAVAALTLTGCTPAASGAAGTWQQQPAPETGKTPELVLAADGTLSGTDGCNQLAGGWTQSGSTVTFTDVATTLMACEGVDTWLMDLSTATLSGDTLTMLGGDGATIGELHRG